MPSFIRTTIGLFKKSRRFADERRFRANRDNQVRMAPATLQQLRQVGVEPERSLKLEYFFYTDTPDKAASLAQALAELGYSVEHGPAAHDRRQQVVTGWTVPMSMTDQIVCEWTGRMCDLGFEHDCEFDGWGTAPAQ